MSKISWYIFIIIVKKSGANIVFSTSCSLLHVPYTLKNESSLSDEYKRHFSFADEKLKELADLKKITASDTPTYSDR